MESILNSFEVWSNAQELKSKLRVKSIENISLEGIARLRELILELAVRGKLIQQNSEDSDANDLYKHILEEKARFIHEGQYRDQAKLPNPGKNDILFSVPKKWIWVRLGNLGYTQTGGTPDKNDKTNYGDDIPFIKPADIYNDRVDYSNEGLSSKGAKKLGRIATKNSILMVCIGTIGKSNSIDRSCTFNQQINSITPYIDITKYLLLAMQSNYFQTMLWDKSSSTTIAIINKGKWENCCIPLPPIEEQHRIVAKVNELMALCDKLEAQKTSNLKTHQLLVKSLLETLTRAADAKALQTAWERLAPHFDTLFCTEDSIEQLKQTILQLAVMGKLVKQDAKDEPAGELLKRMLIEKERLVNEEGKKRQNPLPKIENKEKLFKLPHGWEWARLQEATSLITDGKHGDCQNQLNSGYYFLSAKDIKDGKLNYEFAREINFLEFQETHRRTDLSHGDICMVNTGATVGKLAIAIDDPKTKRTTFQKSVAVIKPLQNYLHSEYLKLFLSSEEKKLLVKSGGSAINNLLLGDLKLKVLPLPPLAEQKRIVAKVEELFALCDALNSKIQKAQALQNLLAKRQWLG